MSEILTFSLTVFTGFFAIMNPIAGVPVFLSLVDGASKAEKKRISRKAVLVAFFITLVFTVFGAYIFKLFEITIPAFKITGGIMIFYVGFEMLQSRQSEIQHLKEHAVDENIAVSPLGIPLLAGPGTIVTAMNYVTNADFLHTVLVILIFGLMCWLTYIAFSAGDWLISKIGKNIITVLGKIMGLIIAIIGTNMAMEGFKIYFG